MQKDCYEIIEKNQCVYNLYAASYLVIKGLLTFTEYSFRTWSDLLGKITILWILPLLGIVWLGVWLKNATSLFTIVRVILLVVVSGIYLFAVYLSFLGLLFTMKEERTLTGDVLVTLESGVFADPEYVCYRRAAVFFKVPYELTVDDKKKFLEEKYEQEFEIKGNAIYSPKIPQKKIVVVQNGMALEDDFIEKIMVKYLTEGVKVLQLDREYYVSEKAEEKIGVFYMQLKSEDDMDAFEQDVMRLLDYVYGKTEFLKEYIGNLGFYLKERESEIKGLISFGKRRKWSNAEGEYYHYPKNLKQYMEEKYTNAQNYQSPLKEATEYAAGTEIEKNDALPNTFEEEGVKNAKLVYDKFLADQGYSYQVCYDAKGNLYLDLGSRPAGETEDTLDAGTYRFTLCSDRLSKNGRCALFVLYKEHYIQNADGTMSEDCTKILEMYAVELSSGNVVLAEKQSWEDLGSKEYRKLTGE